MMPKIAFVTGDTELGDFNCTVNRLRLVVV